MTERDRVWWRILKENVERHEIFVLAASIAYGAVFSVFPLLVAVIALLSLMVGPSQAQQAAMRGLQPYLPAAALTLVRDTLNEVARTRGTAGTLAAAVLLWSATAVAGSLRHALNRVLGAARPRPFWRRKLLEFTMVVLGGAFLGLSVISSAALAALQSVPALAGVVDRLRGLQAVTLSMLTPWLFSSAAFLMIYRFMPNIRVARRSLAVGTITAMVLFEATKRGFFWYVSTLATYPLVYGPLAGLIVFMLWVYLAALLVLLGAEVMRAMESSRPGVP